MDRHFGRYHLSTPALFSVSNKHQMILFINVCINVEHTSGTRGVTFALLDSDLARLLGFANGDLRVLARARELAPGRCR